MHVQDGTVALHYPRLAWLTDPGALLGPPPSGQITLNGSIPWHMRVGRGANRLILDDQHFGAIGNSTRWQSPDYDQRSDRYDIAISGGADTLTVNSR